VAETVELPRWMVIGAGLLLLGTLSSTFFLLGRSTAPVAHTARTPDHTEPAVPRDPAPVDAGVPEPPTVLAPSVAPSAAPSPRPAATDSPASDDDDQAAVAYYLEQLDAIGGLDPSGIDPNALIQQAMRGDVSGIDTLIAQHKERQAAIARLPVPAACETHHARLTQLAADGLQVMVRLRSGIVTGDVQELMALQPAAMHLQSLGHEVSQLEAALRSGAGN